MPRIHEGRFALAAGALLMCLAVPTAATAKLPATTNTKIVPGKSMGGVKLDMTKTQVFAKWGKGSCVAGAGYCEWQRKKPTYVSQYERAVVSFVGGKAVKIHVQGAYTKGSHKLVPGPLAKWKTSKGVSLGSKRGAVPKAYPGAKPSGGDAPGFNLLLGSGRNVTITSWGTPGFGASPALVGDIGVDWSNCHFDLSTTC
jgi:hypothetical protein